MVLIVCLTCFGLLIISTISISRAATFEREENRGWRINYAPGACLYQEKVNGAWEQIELRLESPGWHGSSLVVLIPSVDQWQRYPAWARARRDEIIGRVKSELGKQFRFEPEPDSVSRVAPKEQRVG